MLKGLGYGNIVVAKRKGKDRAKFLWRDATASVSNAFRRVSRTYPYLESLHASNADEIVE